jgi:hypothetical protein
LTVTGVDDRATHTCTITATADGITIGMSATVAVDPVPALPA